ncbi:MAG: hypothetical protein Q9169_006465, partial [Polycauliona sp. 2 TL-2023]
KYHPMDDVMRPSAAATRRAAHGLSCTPESSATSSRSATLENESGSDEDEDEDEKVEEVDRSGLPANPPRRPIRARPGSPSTRRVTRGEVNGERIVQYSAKHHPMDDVLHPKRAGKVLARTAARACASSASSASPSTSTSPAASASTPAPTSSPISPIDTRSSESEPEPEPELTGWKSLDQRDRLLFILQKGRHPDSAVLPVAWPRVVNVLRELDMPATLADVQERYSIIYHDLRSFYQASDEPAHEPEYHYAEDFDVFDVQSGDKYWTHRVDKVVRPDQLIAAENIGIEATESQNDDEDEDEHEIGIHGGPDSYNDAAAYIAQTLGVTGSETQGSTEMDVLDSLRNQLSTSIDMLELDKLTQEFQSSAEFNDGSGPSTSSQTVQASKDDLRIDNKTPHRNNHLSLASPDHNDNLEEAEETRKPLRRRVTNSTPSKGRFAVHEDEPGNTPKIKRLIKMNPRSPGTDIPKENRSQRSYSNESRISMSE